MKINKTLRKPRILTVLAASALTAICVAVAAWGSTNAKPDRTGPFKLNSAASILDRSLQATEHLQQSPGTWQFADLNWSVRQSAPALLNDIKEPERPAEPPTLALKFDHGILKLIHSLMKDVSTNGAFRTYRVQTDGLRAVALTTTVNEQEIPVSLNLWWPAYGDLWTEVSAIRVPEMRFQSQRNSLPIEGDVKAMRLGDDGVVQCYLLAANEGSKAVTSMFMNKGWTIERPPTQSPMKHVFWVHKGDECFEVSDQLDKLGATLLLIRRI